jgi:hypothetical protein
MRLPSSHWESSISSRKEAFLAASSPSLCALGASPSEREGALGQAGKTGQATIGLQKAECRAITCPSVEKRLGLERRRDRGYEHIAVVIKEGIFLFESAVTL